MPCPDWSNSVQYSRPRDIATTGGEVFLTEFGVCISDGNASSVNMLECQYVLQEADRHHHSWAY